VARLPRPADRQPRSVGIQAYAGHHPIPHQVEIGSPHARYAVIEQTGTGWITESFAIPYDWDAAADLAARHDRPQWSRPCGPGFCSGPVGWRAKPTPGPKTCVNCVEVLDISAIQPQILSHSICFR